MPHALPAALALTLGLMTNQGPAIADGCAPTSETDAAAWLARADSAVGLARLGGAVLHFRAMEGAEMNFQSDRSYPPFFSAMSSTETWVDPVGGVERSSAQGVFPGTGPGRSRVVLSGPQAAYIVRDTAVVPLPQLWLTTYQQRPLNPWTVLAAWRRAPAVRVAARCPYRDYERLVLERAGVDGPERLFLDPKTAFPVKLERVEPHYLWGQVSVEYLYSTWLQVGPAYYPSAAFRLVDGATEITRTVGEMALVPRDSAPGLTLPESTLAMSLELPRFLQPIAPDTVRIGPTAFLLVNPGYTQGLVLVRDTVFVLDATQGEGRARQDSAWIRRLFPGRHAVVVVVTDLAWPHIAGVRYWVATGATLVSHRASEAFLQRVVDRRWTRAPDLLERRRASARFRFRAVAESLALAGGDVALYAIDGIGSEGALVAWLRTDRFLWASDYIQDVQRPTLYATGVWRAVHRVGIMPERTAAQHVPLTSWSVIERLARATGP